MTDLPATLTQHLPSQLDPEKLVQLAKEIACDLRDLPVILSDYSLTEEDYDRFKGHPAFKRILDTATLEWNSADSTPKRLAIIAAFGLEQSLPGIVARMMRNDEDLAKVITAGKLLSDIAGVSKVTAQAGGGEKITINIDLGKGDQIRVEKDITPIGAIEVSEDGEGDSNKA